jgi:DNA repair protein RecO
VEVVGNRDFNLLAKAEPIEVFKNIRLDLTKIRLVNYILNFLNKIIKPNHPEEALFSTLVGFLAFSHEQENINLFLIEAFIFKTLCHLGFYQELNKCVKCEQEIQMNKQGEYFFSLSSGGVLCQQVECHAEDVVKFDSEIWELLKNLMNKDWNFINNLQINSEDKEKIQVFVKNIGEYYLGFSIDVFCEV